LLGSWGRVLESEMSDQKLRMWRVEQVEMSYEQWRATVSVGTAEDDKFKSETDAFFYFQKLLKFAGKLGHQFQHYDAPELSDVWLSSIQEKMENKLESDKMKKRARNKKI